MSAVLPAAWYELAAALGAAKAVSSSAMDCLPMSNVANQEVLSSQINHLADMLSGISILLEKAIEHTRTLEQQI